MITLIGACDIVSRTILLPRLLKKFHERSIGIAGLIGIGFGLGLILSSLYVHSAYLIGMAVISITLGEGLFDPSYNGDFPSGR